MDAHPTYFAQPWILDMKIAEPIATCHIRLGIAQRRKKAKKPSPKADKADLQSWSNSISAATFGPDGSLWIATDEHSQLLRLAPTGNDYLLKGVFPLEGLLDLGGIGKSEIDIEGLASDGQYLWLTGSHSSVLKMPGDSKPAELQEVPKQLRLANTQPKPSRKLLARIPFSGEGISARVKIKKKEKLVAGMLPIRRGETTLTDALKTDPHLGAFIAAGLPCKTNGLDVEGLAHAGGKVYLGLRGPVLDDWAMLIEIEPAAKSAATLKLAPRSKRGAPYRKIFLKLGGLGIRDLTMHGDTLYILAGPSMSLDGPVCVFAIPNFAKAAKAKAIKLTPILNLPFMWKADHPESIVVLPGEKQNRLLVICDNPSDDRLKKPGSIRCEIYGLPKP